MRRRRSTWLGLGAAVLGAAAAFSGCAGEETGSLPEFEAPAMPPAVSGGTLLLTRDGQRAIAADPDSDRVWIVELASRSVKYVALEPGDEPGRVAEDAAGRIHVALRRGGAVVTLDAEQASVLARRAVCGAPRGLAFDEAQDALHVACLGGELVTLPAAGGAPTRALRVDADLRDVAVAGEGLAVSRFRAAELLLVDADGGIAARSAPPAFERHAKTTFSVDVADFSASVAWRTVPLPGGGFAMVHQRGQDSAIHLAPPAASRPDPTPPGDEGYGSPSDVVKGEECAAGVVHTAVTLFDAAGQPSPAGRFIVPEATLPVDVAVSKDGGRLAVVAAGSRIVTELRAAEYAAETFTLACTSAVHTTHMVAPRDPLETRHRMPVAAAYAEGGALVVQVRSPPALVIFSDTGDEAIELSNERADNVGHALFHGAARETLGVACASCHPEGAEDGRVWRFAPIGLRRTQDLRGGILQTAPFHWDGDLDNLFELMDEVFLGRMGAPEASPEDVQALATWLDAQPRLPVPGGIDAAAAERGRALFESEAVGCAGCHSGPSRTDNRNADVGTGGTFQTPRLVDLASRGPWMHDGCAKTLRDRFDPACGGAQHGRTSHLTEAEIDDLVAYLETL